MWYISLNKNTPTYYSGTSEKGTLYVRPLYKGQVSKNYSPYSSNTLRTSEKSTTSP